MTSRGLICASGLLIAAHAIEAQPSRPLLASAGAFEILLVDQRAVATLHADALADSMVTRCTAKTRLEGSMSNAEVLAFRAWDFDDAFDRDRETISFLLLPVESLRMDCNDPDTQRRAAALRGVRFSRDTTVGPDREIIDAALFRGRERLSDEVGRPTPLLFVTPWGDRRGIASGWRFDVPLSRLAPGAEGTTDDVYFLVRVAAEASPRWVEIPDATINALWQRAASLRAEALPNEIAPASMLLAAAPSDSVLARTHRSFVDGALQRPVMDAELRLRSGLLSQGDRLAAAVQLASAFSQGGDTPMAQHYLRAAYAAEPCLVLHADTPAPLATLARPMQREGGACRPRGALRFALTGGLIPGGARPSGLAREVVGGLAIASAVYLVRRSMDAFASGRAHYRDYLNVEYTGGAPAGPVALAAYDRAESSRRQGVLFFQAAVGVLTVSVVEGAWSEWLYNRHLRSVRSYGQVQRAP